MNKEQRSKWDSLVNDCIKEINDEWDVDYDRLVVLANSYILKLERELQNIKQTKKIGAILKPLGGPR